MPNPNESTALLLVATVAVLVLGGVGAVMRQMSACLYPRILDLEIAGNVKNAKLLLETWGSANRRRARNVLLLDFLLLAAYGSGGAALALWMSRFAALSNWPWLARSGWFFAYSFLVGAGLDALENLGAITMIGRGGTQSSLLPRLTAICSVTKFITLVIAAQYFLAFILRNEIAAIAYWARSLWFALNT